MKRVVRGGSLLLGLAVATVLFWAGPSWAGGLTKEQEKQVSETLRDVINKGAKLFNDQGDYPACYRLYEGAALTVRPLLGQHPALQGKIDGALAEANNHPSVVQKAFLVRKVLDEVRKQLGGVSTPSTGDPQEGTFTLSGEPAAVKIKPGEKMNVKVLVKRGVAFKDAITADLKPGKGLGINPVQKQLAATETAFTFTIIASDAAMPGPTDVSVTAAGGGKTVTLKIPVTIEKATVQPPLSTKASISGKVTLDGKPLPGGSVGFVPTDAKAPIKLHQALLKADGTYAFAEGEVPPGTYMVGVGPPDKLPPGSPKIEIPKKYQAAVNSTLTFMVKPGAQTFDINLESDKKPVNPPAPTQTSVSGKVTLKGKPLTGGQVHFFSKDGKKAGVATIGADGTFSLDKGLTEATYQIAVTPAPGQPKTGIPEKFQFYSTSGLTYAVKAGVNKLDINL